MPDDPKPPAELPAVEPLAVAWATRTIILVCVAVQLFFLVMGAGFARAAVQAAGLVPARVTGAIVGLPEGPLPSAATFLTHIFLHSGWVHLAMNMVFLAWVGRQVEGLIGTGRFLLLFFAGGIAGGALQVLLTQSSVAPVVGASGAISAVFAAYALMFARSGEGPTVFLGLRLSGGTVRALRYAALWIGLQLLTAVAFNMPGGGGIAIWAHIGGFLAGLLAVPLLRRAYEPA
ncbi:MAG: rhomboid family intramembrane serine protease [Sandaracinobacter sp.]